MVASAMTNSSGVLARYLKNEGSRQRRLEHLHARRAERNRTRMTRRPASSRYNLGRRRRRGRAGFGRDL
jgi:hypothetical protein